MSRKCLKCKKKVNEKDGEDFHLIFDENGIELNLKGLLEECYNIRVTQNRRKEDYQGMCMPCLEHMIDAYDMLQKTQSEAKQGGSSADKPLLSVQLKKEAHSDGDDEVDVLNTVAVKREKKSNEVDSLSGGGGDDGDEELQIEEVYKESKDYEKYFENQKIENEPVDDDLEDPEEYFLDDTKYELVADSDVDIDVFEYKKKILKIDPTITNLKLTMNCVLCQKDIVFHTCVLDHITEHHKTPMGNYQCIAKEDCQEFETLKELAYHLILQHYDLASLEINIQCPECLEGYNNFVEFNSHYCFPKASVGRATRVCNICNIEFLSHKRYRVHQMFHTEKHRPKVCFLCDKIFKLEEDFYEHIIYGHKSESELNLVCRVCDTVWSSNTALKKHVKQHEKDPVERCPICFNSYISVTRLRLHIRYVHKKNMENDCKICGEQFHFKGKLKVHIEKHNDCKVGRVFVCNICGLCETDIQNLQDHTHSDIDTIEFTEDILEHSYCCEFCEMAFCEKSQLKAHRELAQHTVYECDMCEETFDRFQKAKSHRLKHDYGSERVANFPTARHYVCDYKQCEASFLHYHILKKHTTTHVWMNTPKKCKLCGETLRNYTTLIYHLEKCHNELNINDKIMQSCPICLKMFKTKVGLSIHITAKHGEGDYHCDECKETYKSQELLNRHIKAVHETSKCDICGKILQHAKNLKLHINTVHHKIHRFFCSHCNKGFYLACDLREHEKVVHTSEKPIKCDLCSYSCYYPSRLNLHKLEEHEGKRAPFQCEICSKGFYHKGTLRSHMMRHGEKQYKCLVYSCSSAFFTRTALVRHGNNVHKDVDFSTAPKIYKRRNKRKTPLSSDYRRKAVFDYMDAEAKKPRTEHNDVFIDDDDGLSDLNEREPEETNYHVEEVEVEEEGVEEGDGYIEEEIVEENYQTDETQDVDHDYVIQYEEAEMEEVVTEELEIVS